MQLAEDADADAAMSAGGAGGGRARVVAAVWCRVHRSMTWTKIVGQRRCRWLDVATECERHCGGQIGDYAAWPAPEGLVEKPTADCPRPG